MVYLIFMSIREYNKKYYKENKPYYQNYFKNKNRKLKSKVINYYSNSILKCKTCGEERLQVLTIDHINGGGTQHREKVGRGSDFYYWLVKNDYPSGYQVLCMNCNWLKRYALSS